MSHLNCNAVLYNWPKDQLKLVTFTWLMKTENAKVIRLDSGYNKKLLRGYKKRPRSSALLLSISHTHAHAHTSTCMSTCNGSHTLTHTLTLCTSFNRNYFSCSASISTSALSFYLTHTDTLKLKHTRAHFCLDFNQNSSSLSLSTSSLSMSFPSSIHSLLFSAFDTHFYPIQHTLASLSLFLSHTLIQLYLIRNPLILSLSLSLSIQWSSYTYTLIALLNDTHPNLPSLALSLALSHMFQHLPDTPLPLLLLLLLYLHISVARFVRNFAPFGNILKVFGNF